MPVVAPSLLMDEPIYSLDRWVIDLSGHPVELVADRLPWLHLGLYGGRRFEVEHPDLWFDGRWVER